MKSKINLIVFCTILLFCMTCHKVIAGDDNKYYSISDPWVYTIINRLEISNPSNQNIRDINVKVPLMNYDQPKYQEFLGEEFNPTPNKITLSKFGARMGVFNISVIKPGQRVILEQKYVVKNYAIQFQLQQSQVSTDYKNYKDVSLKYLQPETKIESDHPAIIKYAQEVAKNETNPYIIAQKLFADINLFMTYKDEINANKGALNALQSGEGVCEDYTDLYIASARALGIPARKLSGYLYLLKDYTGPPYIKSDGSLDIGLMRHTWPEVFLPEIGWVVLDPTFTYTISSGKSQEKAVDWNKFGKIESGSRHIFFNYEGYDDDKIEYKYTGPNPKVKFFESLEFGRKISPFKDVVSHWAKDSISFLANFRPPIIEGYGNGLFGPNNFVTRAQLVTMLNRALNWGYQTSEIRFNDVKPGHWAYANIAAAKEAGVVGGFPDGTFRPDKKLSRAELAAILERAFDLPYPTKDIIFADLGKPGYAWADASIITLAGNGIAGGYQGGLFKPERYVTRAEVATFLSRILDETFRLKVK